MSRSAPALLVALLVVGAMISVPTVGAIQPAGIAAHESTPDDSTTEQRNESIAPGERLSGVVGVQRAEIDGDVESRSFGIQVAKANTDGAKARVVAQRHRQNEQRLDELERRLDELERARQNGSMSHGEYAARTARTHAELTNVERSLNETADVAEGLPADALEANGVDPESVDTLRERANELSGPEVADLARSIAGPSVDRAPPERTGAPDRSNATAGDRGAGDGDAGNRGAGTTGSPNDRNVTSTETTAEGENSTPDADTKQDRTEDDTASDESAH